MEIGVSKKTIYSSTNYLMFIIPSLIGFCLFLMPIPSQGGMTVFVGIMVDMLRGAIGPSMKYFTTSIFVSSALLSLCYTLLPTAWTARSPYLCALFKTNAVWLSLRLIAGIFSMMTLLQIGPEWVIGDNTGYTAFVEVAGIIFCLIGIGCLLLPLLTDYGFMEFVGTIFHSIFQKIFRLPGRSTIDVLASWVGSSSIAVLVTIRQYETGFYTMREAAVIATNFSAVSVPFVVLIAQVAGISEYFLQLYTVMAIIGIICAIITPKLIPLSRIPDEYYPPVGKQINEVVVKGTARSKYSWAIEQALNKASHAPGITGMLKNGGHNIFDIFSTVMPAGMAIQFIALAGYYHTNIFHIITMPMVPILEFMSIPEAQAAAPGLLLGLLDQFVPAIIAGEIESPITSFVLAGLSVTQLIFFAESAVLILRSNIPLNIGQLVLIFCVRTVIALPILALAAHWIL